MRRLGVTSMGVGIASLVASLSIAVPAAAHTTDQYALSMYQITGVDAVNQSRSGHDLHRYLTPAIERPIWHHLYHGMPDFVLQRMEYQPKRPTIKVVEAVN